MATSGSNTRASVGVLGAGAVACAACCAGPIVGFLAATGIASALGLAVFGVLGLIIVLAAAAVLYPRRRRQRHACVTPTDGSLPVRAPQQLKTRQ